MIQKIKSNNKTKKQIIKITKYDFHSVNDLIKNHIKDSDIKIKKISEFSVIPRKNIHNRLLKYLQSINTLFQKHNLRLIPEIELLELVEEYQNKKGNENDLLRVFSVICNKAFIGPKRVLIDLTDRCNLDCLYCRGHSPLIPKEEKESKKYEDIDFETVKDILKELKELKVEELILVGGGEPTLHKNFIDVVKEAKNKKLKINLSTNGSLLTDKTSKVLIKEKVDRIIVSISAASCEEYTKIHPKLGKNKFKIIKKNLTNLSSWKNKLKNNNTVLIALFVITNYNFHEIEEMVHFTKSMGFNEIQFQLLHVDDFSKFLKLNNEQANKLSEELIKAKELCDKEGIIFNGDIDFQTKNLKNSGTWSENSWQKDGCLVGWNFSFVKPNKEVMFCCGMRMMGVIGNESFKDIWDSNHYKNCRKVAKDFDKNNNIKCNDGVWMIDDYCNYCDNHNMNTELINLIDKFGLRKFFRNENSNKNEKAKDVVLVNLPPSSIENPSLSLALISEYLENKNISHEIVDFNIDTYNRQNNKIKELWNINNHLFWSNSKTLKIIIDLFEVEINNLIEKLSKIKSNILAFSVVDPKERITIEIIKRIKERNPKKKIVIGGPICSSKDSLRIFTKNIPELIDCFVVGEGEQTLTEIISAIKKNENINTIKGVLTYKNGEWNEFRKRETLNINSLPAPKYNKFRLDKYNIESLGIITSRGCINNCVFCKETRLWPNFRFRNANNIFEEIKYHVRFNNLNKFIFYDSAFNSNIKNLEAFCDLVIKNKLCISWSAECIPRKEMTPNILKKMKQAGCHRIVYGIESGSKKILELMKRNCSLKDMSQVLKDTHKANIFTAINIIVGFPGEEIEDIEKTKHFLIKNKKYVDLIDSLSTLQLVEGTYLYENLDKFNLNIPKIEAYNKWTSKDNNFVERNKRLFEVKEFINKLGIPLNRDFSQEESIRDNKDLKTIFKKRFLKQDKPIKMFKKCLKEHGLKYTIKHVKMFIQNKIKRQ